MIRRLADPFRSAASSCQASRINATLQMDDPYSANNREGFRSMFDLGVWLDRYKRPESPYMRNGANSPVLYQSTTSRKMPTGSCFCGAIKVSYTGEPLFKVSPSQACKGPLSCALSLLWLPVAPFHPALIKRQDHKMPLTLAQSICHCLDDRKITGSLFSTVFTIPKSNFTITTGTPKSITKISDHGKSITSHFCGDCGTTLFRSGGSQPEDALGLRAGVLDDPKIVNEAAVEMEFVCREEAGVAEGGGGGSAERCDVSVD